MNLIAYFSRVAEKDFKTLTEVRDYFIEKEFLELIGSSDIDFASALYSVTSKKPDKVLCPDLYDFIEGLLVTYYGCGYYNVLEVANSAKSLFLNYPNIKLDTETGELRLSGKAEFVETSIMSKAKRLKSMNFYLQNKVLTPIGELKIGSFCFYNNADGRKVVIGDLELPLDKFVLCVLLLTTMRATKREGKSSFSQDQFKILKNNLLKYSNNTNAPSEGRKLLLPRQIFAEVKKYDRAKRNNNQYDLFPIEEIYRNFFEAINEFNTKRTYNLCILLNAYKDYSTYKSMISYV